MIVPIGVSNRHIHLNNQDVEILFGKNYELKELRPLNQTNEFSSTDVVTIKTDKSEITNVRVLGPIRKYTQVEISRTDAYKLGINPPVRNSGDLKGSETVTLIGPKGSIKKEDCCIQAIRHIHLTKEKLEELNLHETDTVSLNVSGEKSGILNNVFLKVQENAYFECHLDTDDANAFLLKTGDVVEIIKESE